MRIQTLVEVLEEAIEHLVSAVAALKKADLLLSTVDPAMLVASTLVPSPVVVTSPRSAAMKRAWDRRKQAANQSSEE